MASPNYIYVCRFCRTPYLALEEDKLHQFQDEDGNQVAIFTKVVNVRVDKPIHHYHVFPHTVADIYCVRCEEKLGFKYIQIGSHHVMHNKRIENGYLQILTERISHVYGHEIN